MADDQTSPTQVAPSPTLLPGDAVAYFPDPPDPGGPARFCVVKYHPHPGPGGAPVVDLLGVEGPVPVARCRPIIGIPPQGPPRPAPAPSPAGGRPGTRPPAPRPRGHGRGPKGKRPRPDQFFVVWSPQGGPPMVRIRGFQVAKGVAEKLAKRVGGQDWFVLASAWGKVQAAPAPHPSGKGQE